MLKNNYIFLVIFLFNSHLFVAMEQKSKGEYLKKLHNFFFINHKKMFLGAIPIVVIFLSCFLYKYLVPVFTNIAKTNELDVQDEYLREIDCCQNHVWKNDQDDFYNFIYSLWRKREILGEFISFNFSSDRDFFIDCLKRKSKYKNLFDNEKSEIIEYFLINQLSLPDRLVYILKYITQPHRYLFEIPCWPAKENQQTTKDLFCEFNETTQEVTINSKYLKPENCYRDQLDDMAKQVLIRDISVDLNSREKKEKIRAHIFTNTTQSVEVSSYDEDIIDVSIIKELLMAGPHYQRRYFNLYGRYVYLTYELIQIYYHAICETRQGAALFFAAFLEHVVNNKQVTFDLLQFEILWKPLGQLGREKDEKKVTTLQKNFVDTIEFFISFCATYCPQFVGILCNNHNVLTRKKYHNQACTVVLKNIIGLHIPYAIMANIDRFRQSLYIGHRGRLLCYEPSDQVIASLEPIIKYFKPTFLSLEIFYLNCVSRSKRDYIGNAMQNHQKVSFKLLEYISPFVEFSNSTWKIDFDTRNNNTCLLKNEDDFFSKIYFDDLNSILETYNRSYAQ